MASIQNMNHSYYDLTFKHPRRMLIYGPSGSGKSKFVENILIHMFELFDFYFDSIIYCSGQSFPKFDTIHGININKVNTIDNDLINNLNENERNLIILDDNLYYFVNEKIISDLFTKLSHHKNIFVIILVQNLFPKSKYMRDISLNSTYIVLMANPRDNRQVRTLSYQIDGADSLFIWNCYNYVTKNKPFSYILLDFDQESPQEIRVRTNIFPNEYTYCLVKIS